MDVLERPPTDEEARRGILGLDDPTEPDAPVHDGDDEPARERLIEADDSDGGGYAMKFGRRRKTKSAAAIAEERKAAKLASLAKKKRDRMIWLVASVAVPGLVLVAILTVLGRGAGDRVALPKELPPASFAGLLDFTATERVGTLFQGTLRGAPSAEPAAHADFRSRVETIAATLATEGYESLLIMGPDGTTLASGPVRDIAFAPPGARGT